ncbi:hypothetical protein BpHYR1_002363 [Brachionus plicatilis]|uniref:Uncharacterized protein n=1 Tax=Brachionus plicatilis TaxID=10195 RepID=A0A3M7Q9K6_BRAPC|nr:hypothetical protein BpHYR1_002363 [Brachionus plicatilis]
MLIYYFKRRSKEKKWPSSGSKISLINFNLVPFLSKLIHNRGCWFNNIIHLKRAKCVKKIKFLNKKIYERKFNTPQTSTSTNSSSEYDFGYEYNTCTRMKTRLCFEYKCIGHSLIESDNPSLEKTAIMNVQNLFNYLTINEQKFLSVSLARFGLRMLIVPSTEVRTFHSQSLKESEDVAYVKKVERVLFSSEHHDLLSSKIDKERVNLNRRLDFLDCDNNQLNEGESSSSFIVLYLTNKIIFVNVNVNVNWKWQNANNFTLSHLHIFRFLCNISDINK